MVLVFKLEVSVQLGLLWFWQCMGTWKLLDQTFTTARSLFAYETIFFLQAIQPLCSVCTSSTMGTHRRYNTATLYARATYSATALDSPEWEEFSSRTDKHVLRRRAWGKFPGLILVAVLCLLGDSQRHSFYAFLKPPFAILLCFWKTLGLLKGDPFPTWHSYSSSLEINLHSHHVKAEIVTPSEKKKSIFGISLQYVINDNSLGADSGVWSGDLVPDFDFRRINSNCG